MLLSFIIGFALVGCAQNDVKDMYSNTSVSIQEESVNSAPATAAPSRDGNIAIREEFEIVKNKNTIQDYGLFIARHPNHALAQEAEALRDALQDKQSD